MTNTANQMTVTLKDHMGSDLSVVNAARVSFAKESDFGELCWQMLSEKAKDSAEYIEYLQMSAYEQDNDQTTEALVFEDWKLIQYLAKHNHWTPFGHTSVTLHVKAPIFIARQLGKHQVGLVWNEVSRRYVDDEPEFYVPEAWRKRPEDGIKQGSSDETLPILDAEFQTFMAASNGYSNVDVLIGLSDWHEISAEFYNRLLELNVAPEMARMVLPQSMMTEWYWTGSIAAFARVYKLRSEESSQREVQEVASQIDQAIRPLFPVAWDALNTL